LLDGNQWLPDFLAKDQDILILDLDHLVHPLIQSNAFALALALGLIPEKTSEARANSSIQK
jgi:hypothetical protein